MSVAHIPLKVSSVKFHYSTAVFCTFSNAFRFTNALPNDIDPVYRLITQSDLIFFSLIAKEFLHWDIYAFLATRTRIFDISSRFSS